MKKTIALWAAPLAALACASSAHAHHSGSMYAPAPLWVTGTVVRFERKNPHTIITLEERSAGGQLRRWAVEGPGQTQLDRMGAVVGVPTVGDHVEFCAFPYRPAEELSRMFGVDFSERRSSTETGGPTAQFVAGHVMVMPDGEMRLWEPHGLISECIRSSDDQRQSWLDFLNSSPSARDAWCAQRDYAHVRATASLRELVEDVDSSIDDPCP